VLAGKSPTALPLRGSAPAWSRKQYEQVLARIAEAPHHAVAFETLEEALGSNGRAALLSMVEYNFLAVRSPSVLARDLPDEVYQVAGTSRKKQDVVVMPSPPDTECVVDMLQRGELPRWKDAAAAAGEDAV
jgi:hypothetical protein